MAIKRSADTGSPWSPVWGCLSQTKDFDDEVRREDPHTNSETSVASISAEGAEAKKTASKSCRQVNVGVAESVKVHSPEVPGVPHKTQEEPQKPKASRASTSRRQPKLS